jgi:predicted dehydrogenase
MTVTPKAVTYRAALIGCGHRGTSIGRGYADHRRTELVGLCDLDTERLQTLGDELGVTARFTDVETMLDAVQPQIVAIPTGTEFHYELMMRVLDHGPYHIDVEKPICVDLEQADAVLRRARERRVQVAVHHQGRVSPAARAAAAAVADGLIGDVIHAIARGKGYYGGYGIMNIGCHLLTGAQAFLGRCRRVTASLRTDGRPTTPDDVVPSPSGMGTIAGERLSAELEFGGGINLTLMHDRLPSVHGGSMGVELMGTVGRVLIQHGGAWHLPTPFARPDDGVDRWTEIENPLGGRGDTPELRNGMELAFVDEYVRALDAGDEHESSGAVGTHSLEMIMGAFESAAYGRPVDLPQQRRDHPLLRWRSEHGLGPPPAAPRPYVEWLAHEDRRLGRLARG